MNDGLLRCALLLPTAGTENADTNELYNAFFVNAHPAGTIKFPLGFARMPDNGGNFWSRGGRKMVPPSKLLKAVKSNEWTWEFWAKVVERLDYETHHLKSGTFVDMGSFATTCFRLDFDALANRVSVVSETGGYETEFEVDFEPFLDTDWHHFAIVRKDGKFTFFMDGKSQQLAEVRNTEPKLPEESFDHAFDLLFGYSMKDEIRWMGAIDEMRVSDVARYTEDFTPPGSFSRNYGSKFSSQFRFSDENKMGRTQEDGPPLLFADNTCSAPVELGGRKHVFIDDILLEEKENVSVVQNPPPRDEYDIVDFPELLPWEDGNVRSFYDHEGKIHFFVNNGGYGNLNNGAWSLLTSEDGLTFDRPKLNLFKWRDQDAYNAILVGHDGQGHIFRDTNPNVHPEERFKFTMMSYCRGIYVYVSPDGIHWRRNEVCALPLDPSGGVESFWDDQKGVYASFLRAHNLPLHRKPIPDSPAPGNRYAAYAETNRVTEPWPFTRLLNPTIHHDPLLPLVSGPPGELPTPFRPNEDGLEVYRTRAVKYEWAPDVYLAFVRRFYASGDKKERRETELATSRDGLNWTYFGTRPAYIPAEGEFRGIMVEETLSAHGLVRRGDELWTYASVKQRRHGGVAKGDKVVRLTQRLDGFTSLDAGEKRGTAITKPLVFSGSKMELNVKAAGSARVALLNEEGHELNGYTLADCDAIQTDNLRHVVTWNGKEDVSSFSGKTVRLKFEMEDAKLYAMKFVK